MHIYVAGSVDGPKKIGIAGSPEDRIRNLQVGNPTAMTLLATYPVEAAHAISMEQASHAVLKNLKVRGEWFDATLDQVKFAVTSAITSVAEGAVLPAPFSRPPRITPHEPFTADNYLMAIEKLGLTEALVPRFLGCTSLQARRWASGIEEVPVATGMLLRLMIALRLSVEDTQGWVAEPRVKRTLSVGLAPEKTAERLDG